ncbi:hypothetical protein BVG80_08615 [Sphingobacteriales bacterium TSM_CSM]|nr:hypothetical protein BVG80_08615 [Sphingobacteriales bacterium TSM_CSM]
MAIVGKTFIICGINCFSLHKKCGVYFFTISQAAPAVILCRFQVQICGLYRTCLTVAHESQST